MDEVGPHRRGWEYQLGRKDGIEGPNNAGDPHIQRRFVPFQLVVAAAESNEDPAFSHQLTLIPQNPMCLAALSEDDFEEVESEREEHSSFGFPHAPAAWQSSQQDLRDSLPNHPVFLLHLRELRRDALQGHSAWHPWEIRNDVGRLLEGMQGRMKRKQAVKVAMARLGAVEEPWKEVALEVHAEMSVLATNPLSVELGEDLGAVVSSEEVG